MFGMKRREFITLLGGAVNMRSPPSCERAASDWRPRLAVPEDVTLEKTRKSRERKRSKRLKRQQPERKEKYRECQCRANRKQHYKLSKPSARHDRQRQRSGAAGPVD
jgi:hypothetical protein